MKKGEVETYPAVRSWAVGHQPGPRENFLRVLKLGGRTILLMGDSSAKQAGQAGQANIAHHQRSFG